MLACVDVDYEEWPGRPTRAKAAVVVFSEWTAEWAVSQHVRVVNDVPAYVPGQFFQRELPCVLAVLEWVEQPLDLVIVDGYVLLDGGGKLGLGGHLYEALGRRIPVVGVAKHKFGDDDVAIEVLRGDSARPLFVTAIGVDPQAAADDVTRMHGKFRLPTMLKRVDRLCRDYP